MTAQPVLTIRITMRNPGPSAGLLRGEPLKLVKPDEQTEESFMQEFAVLHGMVMAQYCNPYLVAGHSIRPCFVGRVELSISYVPLD